MGKQHNKKRRLLNLRFYRKFLYLQSFPTVEGIVCMITSPSDKGYCTIICRKRKSPESRNFL